MKKILLSLLVLSLLSSCDTHEPHTHIDTEKEASKDDSSNSCDDDITIITTDWTMTTK